jgi:hypothetical protein
MRHMRLRRVLGVVAVATVAALAVGASPARAADPLEGRWELVDPSGRPVGGPIYDVVATSPTTLPNRVVWEWPVVCGPRSGDLTLTRSRVRECSRPTAEPTPCASISSPAPSYGA